MIRKDAIRRDITSNSNRKNTNNNNDNNGKIAHFEPSQSPTYTKPIETRFSCIRAFNQRLYIYGIYTSRKRIYLFRLLQFLNVFVLTRNHIQQNYKMYLLPETVWFFFRLLLLLVLLSLSLFKSYIMLILFLVSFIPSFLLSHFFSFSFHLSWIVGWLVHSFGLVSARSFHSHTFISIAQHTIDFCVSVFELSFVRSSFAVVILFFLFGMVVFLVGARASCSLKKVIAYCMFVLYTCVCLCFLYA